MDETAGLSALAKLLRTPTTSRRPNDYEIMFDDFVAYAGGGRVTDRFTLPSGVKNADYHFDFADCEALLELKQVSDYRPGDTIDAYFAKLMNEGRVRRAKRISATRFAIRPDSLSNRDWERFYRTFRPRVTKHLEKAARQLKETDALLLEHEGKPRVRGLLLINSGDYNLPLDLMHRLVEWRTKREWKNGFFSKLDFVSCLCVDLIRNDQHPLQGRHIARPNPSPMVEPVVRHIYDRWLHYVAPAIGAEVTFHPGEAMPDPPMRIGGTFTGKVRWVENA
jgi:hypothetical protein